uniref:Uncharacterized protein n=1 Tax=Geospiza parvula TaxID=87175 RepID=A0A8C3N0P5_GEOPR
MVISSRRNLCALFVHLILTTAKHPNQLWREVLGLLPCLYKDCDAQCQCLRAIPVFLGRKPLGEMFDLAARSLLCDLYGASLHTPAIEFVFQSNNFSLK